ncbi:MAG: hypothetical protein HZC14_02070 [Candidatus Niyogibacteria bacterium]|nr:hypothetical protein [Candidatus Niyogibacteria bacterium]
MNLITFGMIVTSGLLPIAYVATLHRFHIACQIVIWYAVIYTALPILLKDTGLPTVAIIAPPIGGITTLLLCFLMPPRK